MRKLSLHLDEIVVESFPTTEVTHGRGTVRGLENTIDQDTCNTCDRCSDMDTCVSCNASCPITCASCPQSCNPADCPSADGRC